MSEAKRAELIAATHEAAVVAVDDIAHARKILATKWPDRGDIRRLCVLFRRLLIEDELTIISAPRVGRPMVDVHDNAILESYAEKHPWLTIGAPMAELFGAVIDTRLSAPVDRDNRMSEVDVANPALDGINWRDKSIPVNQLKDFKLVFHRGVWITASGMIKYVAYHGYGVHSVGQKSPVFDLIEELKYSIFMGISEGNETRIVYANIPAEKPTGARFRKMIDLPLLYLFTVGTFLVGSSDIQKLEAIVQTENL